MGGARCQFRDCHVNTTKFPLIHFFRFPLKEPKRYKKWREYAKMEHMLDFSEVRRKNSNICARHFRIECFMNYKMNRLTPSAVPTLYRLTNNMALDYELDLEHGVLVRLEETKYKHLIAPDNFESPLSLDNDKVLLEKFNQLNEKSMEKAKIVVEDHSTSYEELDDEMFETIQVTTPNSKRSREIVEDGEQHVEERTKRCRILNNKSCALVNTGNNNAEVVFDYESLEQELVCEAAKNVDINLLPSDEIDVTDFEEREETQRFLLASDDCKNSYNDEFDDEDVQFVQIHKNENNFHHDLPSNESDSTIVELSIRSRQEDTSISESYNRELLKLRRELSELKKKNEDFNIMQLKLSILETKNAELKETNKENEEIKKKLLSLQMENNCLKRTIKENKKLNDKFQDNCEENKKLKEDAELISRQQETKELKKLLEAIKQKESNSALENKSNKLASNEKLHNEILLLKRNLDLSKKQLDATELKLRETKANLDVTTDEKNRLSQCLLKLEESFNKQQNDFGLKQNDYGLLKTNYDNLQERYNDLEQKYCKLQILQNQENTVTTSVATANKNSTPAISANSLTKSQLFNGIKRYISASMVSLLRMEMFGSSEREWKSDERQVAVDILRMGESVYKYFIDEWRFRLPSLRDVHKWLSQSKPFLDDEEVV